MFTRKRFAAVVGIVALLLAGVVAGVLLWAREDEAVDVTVQPTQIVGLGDSYASGEGIPPYDKESDTGTNRCHRSTKNAFVTVAAEKLAKRSENLACSGAVTDGVLNGTSNETSQIGRIEPRAETVVVMIGGNDVNALAYVFAEAAPTRLNADVVALQPRLTEVYQRVQEGARGARVIAMGYPSIVPKALRPGCPFTTAQLDILNQGTAALNATIVRAAAAAGVESIDPLDAFRGHEICTPEPWVNGLDPANVNASLHPNVMGHRRLAELIVTKVQP